MTNKILVVDDEEVLREMMVDVLECETFSSKVQIASAENGLKAWELFQSEGFDIVITDMKMPVMDGAKLIEQISQVSSGVSFIVVSGYADFDMVVSMMRVGIVDFLRKPFRPEELTAIVRNVIEKGERRRESEELREKLVDAERMRSLGLLAAGVAHEINNPAAFVKGNLEYLEKALPEANPEVKKAIESSLKGIDRIRNIVAALSAGCRESESVDSVNLLKVLEEAELLTSHRLKLHKVIKDISNLLHLQGSSQKLLQILMNLLVNAVDAIEERQFAEKEKVEGVISIEALQSGDKVHIRIQDNGMGMSEETLKKCQEPFFTTKPVGKGTGLGLWMVQDWIRRMGGEIHIKSQLSKGSEFELLLPAAVPS